MGDWVAARNTLLTLRSYDQGTPYDTLQKIESELHLGDFILAHTGIAGLERLYRLYEYIRDGVQARKFETLGEITVYWDRMQNYGIKLELVIESNTTVGVQILTAHQSKGLEYEVVYIPNLLDKVWGNPSNREKFALPSSITGGKLEAADKNEEERRLLFVAMTRAKKYLTLSAPESENGKAKVFSEFLPEIAISPTQSPAVAAADFLLKSIHKPIFGLNVEAIDIAYIERFLSNYRLSASDLNRFLESPEEFLQKAILRYPFEDVPPLIFGNCYHAALEYFFTTWKKSGAMPEFETLYAHFERKVYGQFLSPEHITDFLDRGKTGLAGWYALQNATDPLPVEMEYSTSRLGLIFEGIPMKGRIDRIDEIEPGVLRIIDYKTGTPKSENDLKGNTQSGDGGYFRQLLFYKYMLSVDPRFAGSVTRDLIIAYVDGKVDGKYPTITFDVSPEDEEQFLTELRQAWGQMSSITWWREYLAVH